MPSLSSTSRAPRSASTPDRRDARPGSTRGASAWRAWILTLLVPLTTFGAIAVALSIVRRPPAGLLGWALTFVFGLSMAWILTSVLWPARAERTCPHCSERGLERLDTGSTHGIRCRACGFEDAEQSSWLMAEEEGPLEDIVMANRSRRAPRRPSQRGHASAVDSSAHEG